MAEKKVEIEVSAVRGELRMKGTLFVGGTTEIRFTGYTGRSPTLVLFRRDCANRSLVPVAMTSQGENGAGETVYTLNLNTVEARAAFGPPDGAPVKPGAKCPLEAYVIDGDAIPGSIEGVLNQIRARLEEV